MQFLYKISTPSVPKYKTLLTNSHSLRKFVNIISNIKFDNNLYYFTKITLKFIGTEFLFFQLIAFTPN